MESLVKDLTDFAEAFFRASAAAQESAEPPNQLAHIWLMFLQISAWRGFDTMNGKAATLSIAVIKDWLAITGDVIDQFELDVLMRLEGAYWDAIAKGPEGTAQSTLESLKQVARERGRVRTVAVNPKAK